MIHEIIKKSIPEYTCKLPISKKEIKIRPLLVKEEKFITQINELSESLSDKLYSLTQLVNSCCENKIDSMKISMFDFQYLLVDIRKRSITEETKMKIQCPYTEEPVVVTINFNELLANANAGKKTKQVKINDTTLLKLRAPNVNDVLSVGGNISTDDDIMNLIAQVLTDLETEHKSIDLKAEPINEKLQIIESLPRTTYTELKEFVLTSFFILNLNYQTSDSIERTVKVSDFANFLRFYSDTLT